MHAYEPLLRVIYTFDPRCVYKPKPTNPAQSAFELLTTETHDRLIYLYLLDLCPLWGPEWDDRAALLTQQLHQLPAGLQWLQRLQGAHPGCPPEGSNLAEWGPAGLHRRGQDQPEQAAASVQQHQRPAVYTQLHAALRGQQRPSASAHGTTQKLRECFKNSDKKKKISTRTSQIMFFNASALSRFILHWGWDIWTFIHQGTQEPQDPGQ